MMSIKDYDIEENTFTPEKPSMCDSTHPPKVVEPPPPRPPPRPLAPVLVDPRPPSEPALPKLGVFPD